MVSINHNRQGFFTGTILIILGILFLLMTFDIIPDFLFLENLRHLWPIGIVVAGALVLLKFRLSALIILMISVILGMFFLINPDITYNHNLNTTVETHDVLYDDKIEDVRYNIGFGAGILKIKKTDDNIILTRIIANSSFPAEVQLKVYDVDENSKTVSIERYKNPDIDDVTRLFSSDYQKTQWDTELNPQVKSRIDLGYGAAETSIDLTDLQVDMLSIGTGASETTITYDNYPTRTKIGTGASEINLLFPKNTSVLVNVEGGLVDVNLDNFKKVGNKYYYNYENSESDPIEITIEAGASSINGRFID